MDRGTVHDNRGQELSFEGTVLAFTSNLGYSTSETPAEPIGYRGGPSERSRRQRSDAERQLRKVLSPEFLGRLRTIRFLPLSLLSMEAILNLEVSKIFQRFRELHGVDVSLTPAARLRLQELGFSPSQGARHLASVIHRYCNIEVSRRIKQDEVPAPADRGQTVRYLREIRQGDRAFEAGAV